MKPAGSPSEEERLANAQFAQKILEKERKPDPAPEAASSSSSPSEARLESAERWKAIRSEHDHWWHSHKKESAQPREGWMRMLMHWLNIR